LIPRVLKAFLLFISLTILIQVFYFVEANTDFFSSTQYFPYGYVVHLVYYLSFLAITFVFVGKFDFKAVGLKRGASWKKFLLKGILLAVLGAGLRVVFVQGTFGQSYYSVSYYILVPSFLVLGILIGLAEESAFRGYILKNFLETNRPLLAILISSFLFGIYHIDFLGLNFYNLVFWFLYVVQAFTGGIIMASLFYKTKGNLIASMAYHSTNIIIGNAILWKAVPTASYVLAVEIIINIALVIIVRFLPTVASSKPKK